MRYKFSVDQQGDKDPGLSSDELIEFYTKMLKDGCAGDTACQKVYEMIRQAAENAINSKFHGRKI